MAGLTIRPATPADLPRLYRELARGDHEQVALEEAIVYVAELDGEPVGFAAARMIVQLEPLHLFAGFRAEAHPHARRRATLALARAIDGYLRRQPWARHGYYCSVRDQVMQGLARAFGFRDVYRGSRWFLKEF